MQMLSITPGQNIQVFNKTVVWGHFLYCIQELVSTKAPDIQHLATAFCEQLALSLAIVQ